jgi:hypothetical protein
MVVKEADALWSRRPMGQTSAALRKLVCFFARLADDCSAAESDAAVIGLLKLNSDTLRGSLACLRIPPTKDPVLKAVAATRWTASKTRYQHA